MAVIGHRQAAPPSRAKQDATGTLKMLVPLQKGL
jgi:hypothetical protein